MIKLLFRFSFYLFIILLLPYLYFLWQAKQGVDSFLILHPVDGEFEYQWLWLDLEGKIALQDVAFYQDSEDPVFTAERIDIIPTSLFDLLDAKEHVVYNEFPSLLKINVINGRSNQTKQIFSLFNVKYQEKSLDFFYPQQCIDSIEPTLPRINFTLTSQFMINPTADDVRVKFKFNSKEFSKIAGDFKLNRFSDPEEEGGGYLSNLKLDFSSLSWLQQNTQKCLQALKVDRSGFNQQLGLFLLETAKDHRLILSDQAIKSYLTFAFVPQRVQLSFDLQEGRTFNQIPLLPIYEYQQLTGLSISLNGNTIPSVFLGYEKDPITTRDPTQQTEEQSTKQPPPIKIITLRPNKTSLLSYIGSKIELRLHNEKVVVGYLEKVYNHSMRLVQLESRGKTTLPFKYKNIRSIRLLQATKINLNL